MAPRRKPTPSSSAPTPTPTPTPTSSPPSQSPPPAEAAPTDTTSGRKRKTGGAEPVGPIRRSPRFNANNTEDGPAAADAAVAAASAAVAAAAAASPSASLSKGVSGSHIEKKSSKASSMEVDGEDVADEGSKSGENSESDDATADKVTRTVVIEHCTLAKLFTDRANELKAGLEQALPGVIVLLNPVKPRRGCFVVRADGEVSFTSLLDLKRPFNELKALDMQIVIADIVNRIA